MPRDVDSRRATALVVLLITMPPMVTLWLAPHAPSAAEQADIIGLFIYPVLLTAALNIYFQWRLTDDPATGRLSIVLFAAAVGGLARVALRLEYADELVSRASQRILVDVLFAAVLLTVLTLRPHRPSRIDPAGLGIAIGLVFSALRLTALADAPRLDPGPVGVAIIQLCLLSLYILIGVALLRLRPLPGWVRLRIVVALILLRVNQLITYPYTGESWVAVVAIVTDLAGAALLTSTSLALLRRSTRRRRQEIQDLHEQIEEAEQHHRGDRERLHEIGATVAGIASANRLMSQPDELPSHRRVQLVRMVGSEIARLERLMQPVVRASTPVDLDDAIHPLVVAHHARGLDTHWSPTGLTAHGRGDDIAEVVHILLDNAARHADGAPVWVTGAEVDDDVEIRVRDTGPGVPAELKDVIFEDGERGPESSGQGIGLHLASRLMEDMGGSVRLEPSSAGSTFVLRMPTGRHGVPPAATAQ